MTDELSKLLSDNDLDPSEESVSDTPEYKEGWDAFASDLFDNDNPYTIGCGTNGRYRWFMGYYDNKYRKFYQ